MDRYFNNGTGVPVPMTEDEYSEYLEEEKYYEPYKLSQEEKDYLVGKTFELFYYTSNECDETETCRFWLGDDDQLHFGIGLFTLPIIEEYADLIAGAGDVEMEGKEPFELFCLNFMYNVLSDYGSELYDLFMAANDSGKAYLYLIRDENGDDLFEGEVDWLLAAMID